MTRRERGFYSSTGHDADFPANETVDLPSKESLQYASSALRDVDVMREFKSTNIELGSFVVSVYAPGYAFGTLLIAPLSELYGRLYLYHACNILFVIFTVACAVSTSSEYAHRVSVPRRLRRICTVDTRWRYDRGYDSTGEERRSHVDLAHGIVDWAGDRPGRRWIPVTGQGMEMDFLGSRDCCEEPYN